MTAAFEQPLAPTLIVGLGSSHGDDRSGWLLVEILAAEGLGPWQVKRASHPHQLLDWLEGVDRLIVADACQPAGSPGTLRRWSWPSPEILRLRSAGTHDFDLATVLELAECLGGLPAEVTIWSIEAASCQPNSPLSEAVESRIPELARQIKSTLS